MNDPDDIGRLIVGLAEELLAEHGQPALNTFGDLLKWVADNPGQGWQRELEDGIAALRRGDCEQVAARLLELET